jgi:hypothetical protein
MGQEPLHVLLMKKPARAGDHVGVKQTSIA